MQRYMRALLKAERESGRFHTVKDLTEEDKPKGQERESGVEIINHNHGR